MSIKWNNKEIVNPLLRLLVGVFGVFLALFGVVLTLLVLFILIPLSVPVHLFLKICGRKGFADLDEATGTFSYKVELDGFRKADR